MRKMFRKLHNDSGMSFAELLMAVLIMSIIFTAVGGGVVVMRNNYEKVTLKARAQVLIATAISAINMDLEAATSVTLNDSGNEVTNFYSSRRDILMRYGADSIESGSDTITNGSAKVTYKGITQIPVTSGDTLAKYPLVSQKVTTDSLYTDFSGAITFDKTEGYFRYTIIVKKKSDNRVMETMTVMVSPISPIEVK